MNASGPALVLLTGALWAQPATGVERLGLSQYDEVLLCARQAFGKPVIGFDGWPRIADVKCATTAGEMREAFTAKGLRVLELRDWVYLVPEDRFHPEALKSPVPEPFSWKRLEIVRRLERFRLNPGSRHLTPEEERTASAGVFGQIRMVPKGIGAAADQRDIYGPASPDGETAVMEMALWLDAHRLASSLPEAIVAFLARGTYGGYGRLAYGEIRDGRYEMLWDSPLFYAANLSLGYSDVDGDGVDDILVSNWYGNGRAEALSIFSRTGVELTRRNPCDEFVLKPGMESRYGGQEAATCPVVGTEIEIAAPVNGRKDLLVQGYGASEPQTLRYRLQGGHYMKVAPLPGSEPR